MIQKVNKEIIIPYSSRYWYSIKNLQQNSHHCYLIKRTYQLRQKMFYYLIWYCPYNNKNCHIDIKVSSKDNI